jgi:hypothetical protein
MRSSKQIGLLLCLSMFVDVSRTLYAGPIIGSNLIVNGDAEAGSGAADASSQVVVPGWIISGSFTAVQYNAAGDFPTSGSPGPAIRGANFFAGGPDNSASSALQLIDVSLAAGVIDTGTVNYSLDGYLGGFANQGDFAVVSVGFLSATNALLGTATIGPVSVIDRGGVSGLLARGHRGALPIGTRGIEVELEMTRQAGTYNDGYADNLSFVLTSVPEPSSCVMLGSALGGLLLAGLRKAKAA